jgi:hypothetical protein
MAIALADGKAEILAMHVILEIDEGLALDAGYGPDCLFRRGEDIVLHRAELSGCRLEAKPLCHGRALPRAVRKAGGKAANGANGAGECHPVQIARCEKGCIVIRPDRFAASVAGKVDDRAETACHGQGINIQPFRAAL